MGKYICSVQSIIQKVVSINITYTYRPWVQQHMIKLYTLLVLDISVHNKVSYGTPKQLSIPIPWLVISCAMDGIFGWSDDVQKIAGGCKTHHHHTHTHTHTPTPHTQPHTANTTRTHFITLYVCG